MNRPNETRDSQEVHSTEKFAWKNEILRIALALIAEAVFTSALNWFYRLYLAVKGAVLPPLFAPVLITVGAVLFVPFFVFPKFLRKQAKENETPAAMPVTKAAEKGLGIAGFIILGVGIVMALNAIDGYTIPLRRVEWTADTVNDPVSFVIQQDLSVLTLRARGDGFTFPIEIEKYGDGEKNIEKLDIEGLEQDTSITGGSRFYMLRKGVFIINGRFRAGDRLEIKTRNTAQFEGKIILELTGSKIRE
jgi:hypothetical protein